jgi:hypothetical protein
MPKDDVDLADEADDEPQYKGRAKLEVGTKLYFNGGYQFDGFRTEDEALDTYRDEDVGTTIGAKIEIVARQFVGIFNAEVTFGSPNDAGVRPTWSSSSSRRR